MRNLIAVGWALMLAGCATSTAPYGNHVELVPEQAQQLADEAVKQLTVLWPPARTRFELQQPTSDAFGAAFVQGLRERGYALQEFSPQAALNHVENEVSAAVSPAGPAKTAPEAQPLPTLALRYVLDEAGEATLYRLTLGIGTQSLSRPYRVQHGVLVAAGHWVRKE